MLRLLPLLLVLACESSGLQLAVDVLSDLQPGVEVDRIEVRLDDVAVFDGIPSSPLALGARVADLEVDTGDHVVAGRAFFRGEMLAERRVLVQVREDQALTVALTRNCRNVRCDEAGTTCANAMCVDPQCSPETPQFCEASVQCETNADCSAAGECGTAQCQRGSCLIVDDGRCGGGFFCAGDEGCVVAPVLVDASVRDGGGGDAGGGDAGTDAGGSDAGRDTAPDTPTDAGADAGPDVPRTCPEPWGSLPVTSAAVVGAGSPTTMASITPASALLSPTMTMEMWIRFLEPTSSMLVLGNANGTGGFLMRVSTPPSGDPRVTYIIETSGFLFFAPGLTDGCWHHIALVRDLPNGQMFYVQDGARQMLAIEPRGAELMAGDDGLYVGRSTSDTPAHIALHHLRFWNAALNDGELDALRVQSAGSDARLIDEFPMQTSRVEFGVDVLDSRGSLEGILGSWAPPRGSAPGTLMTLGALDVYAASL